MIKRFMALLAALLLGGAACAEGCISPNTADMNSVGKNLLALLGVKRTELLFSYSAPEGSLGTVMSLWTLEDGTWTRTCILGGTAPGQGELLFGECLGAGYYMSLQATHLGAGTAVEDTGRPAFDTRRMKSGMALLQEQTACPLNVEIPIALQVFSASGEMPEVTLALYDAPAAIANVDYAYAVTICFTNSPVEPISMDIGTALEAGEWALPMYDPGEYDWSGWENDAPFVIGIPDDAMD